MKRQLFCQYSPTAYRLSVLKECAKRNVKDAVSGVPFACERSTERLPCVLYRHNSLIRRVLGNTRPELQENKAVNLALTAPLINGIRIGPGEVFSFWHLVGKPTQARGYREGLMIANAQPVSGIGGGLCQFTNLIHWMILHTPLEICEHHHHDAFDLFPDYNRQVPFGVGTSIAYNYIDYRFRNPTEQQYQLIVYLTDTHLCGELRTEQPLPVKYHIQTEEERFVRIGGQVYRKGKVYRTMVDKTTGKLLKRELLQENHALVLYDTDGLGLTIEEDCTESTVGRE